MQKPILFLMAIICFVGAKAQNSLNDQLQQARFNIIKRTVEFLSTDTETFNQVKSNICDGCKTIDDLKKFAADNGLTNADTRVINPLARITIDSSANKWKESLTRFKQQAPERITGGGKDRRKQLKGYNDYLASLNTIVEEVKPGQTAGVRQTNPGAVPTEQQGTGATAGEQQADTTAAKNGAAVAATGPGFLSSKWVPYGIAAILLVGLIITWMDNKKSKETIRNLTNDKKVLKNDLQFSKSSSAGLKNEVAKLKEELKNKEDDLQAADDLIRTLQNEKETSRQDESPTYVMPEKPSTKPAVQMPKAPVANIKYAKYADMGDGFSNAELLDKPDDETIFELTLASANSGEYKITGNPDAQKYALSNAQYFLGKTCQYDAFPSANASIKTDLPGTVKLNGGKWTITNPAKISFG